MVEKKSPTWNDVKARLADFNRTNLLALVKDLYGASKDNQAFLHARFDLGADPLKPYKIKIDRWLSPDLLKNQSCFRFQGQTCNYRLSERYRATLRTRRTDGVLL